ncbi:MAG: hypothetical protein ACR2NA_13680 [Solirubrobacterales bacterium]
MSVIRAGFDGPIAQMVHLRIIAPTDRAEKVVSLLCAMDSVTNVVRLEECAHKPHGDVILADVAREDASVLIGDLRELKIDVDGSIALEIIDAEISAAAVEAEEAAAGTRRTLWCGKRSRRGPPTRPSCRGPSSTSCAWRC